MKHIAQGLISLGFLALVSTVMGQPSDVVSNLRDPTRPPAAILKDSGEMKSSASRDERTSGADDSGNRIQVLKIGKARQFAIIDGQLMQPGDVVDQWRLVSIASQGVVLQNATETQTLASTPAVEKTMRSANVSSAAPSQNSTRRSP